VFDDNQKITFRNNFVLNEKEHRKFYINTSVDMANWDATGTSGPRGSSAFPYFELPAYKLPK